MIEPPKHLIWTHSMFFIEQFNISIVPIQTNWLPGVSVPAIVAYIFMVPNKLLLGNNRISISNLPVFCRLFRNFLTSVPSV